MVAATVPPAAIEPAPVPAEPTLAVDDALPIAGAAGLGLLALLGAGAAMRRRRRTAEDAEFETLDEAHFDQQASAAEFAEPVREPTIQRELPVAAAAPVMAAPVADPALVAPVMAPAMHDPIPASRPLDAPATKLPSGFDLSRFGPHVQAAYRGPTDDNPSLSLKHRLRRASAMDQKVRQTGGDISTPTAPIAARDHGGVTSKLRPMPQSNGGFMLNGGDVRRSLTPATQN